MKGIETGCNPSAPNNALERAFYYQQKVRNNNYLTISYTLAIVIVVGGTKLNRTFVPSPTQ